MDCNHNFKKDGVDYYCGRVRGHDGVHSVCLPENSDSDSHSCVQIIEWNDDGQGRPEDHGVAFSVDYNTGHAERIKIKNMAVFDAKKTLPPGTVFEIRSRA